MKLPAFLRSSPLPPRVPGRQVFNAPPDDWEMAYSLFARFPFDEDLPSCATEEAKLPDGLRQQEPVQGFLQRLGRLPRRRPIQSIGLATWDCGDYLQELLAIRFGEGQGAPAYMLLPKSAPKPLPALLAIHGHGGNYYWGKSKVTSAREGVPTYGHAMRFVRMGYAVLVPDLPGFEGRSFEAQTQAGPWPTAIERLLFGNLLLKGATLMGWDLYELSRAIDYLETRSDIDMGRLGIIGHSMGGTLAPLLMLLDQRSQVCVSSCGISTWGAMMGRHVVHNFACYIPGLMEAADLDELLKHLAPRPLAIISGEDDPNFPRDGVRAVAELLRGEYLEHDAPDALSVHLLPGGHVFDGRRQSLAADFLARWLPAYDGKRADRP
ncbi:MAG: alpha/beta fold hydrolase [Chloroflexi bacterium]|nr:alpha/beta fold hydrolase [Chloroflexota bacterium]